MARLTLRFFGELNDFLPYVRRARAFELTVEGSPAVKDVIESLGVPHTEVDDIITNGASVDFAYRVHNGEAINVYPVGWPVEMSSDLHLQLPPPTEPRFILDVHLGRLAAYLRMLGFDSWYANQCDDDELAARAEREGRILLTRDVGLLKRGNVLHGHFVHATTPELQIHEVAHRYALGDKLRPFTLCLRCNGLLVPAARETVMSQLPPKVRDAHDEFQQCSACGHIYWKGTHFERMQRLIDRISGGCVVPPTP
jgi:uncharacterized protein with PIN domain